MRSTPARGAATRWPRGRCPGQEIRQGTRTEASYIRHFCTKPWSPSSSPWSLMKTRIVSSSRSCSSRAVTMRPDLRVDVGDEGEVVGHGAAELLVGYRGRNAEVPTPLKGGLAVEWIPQGGGQGHLFFRVARQELGRDQYPGMGILDAGPQKERGVAGLADELQAAVDGPGRALLPGVLEGAEFEGVLVLGHPRRVLEIEVGNPLSLEVLEQPVRVFPLVAVGAPEVGEPVLRPVVVPEVPRADEAAAVSRGLQDISDGDAVGRQAGARNALLAWAVVAQLPVGMGIEAGEPTRPGG